MMLYVLRVSAFLTLKNRKAPDFNAKKQPKIQNIKNIISWFSLGNV